jgi:hypothetical protein
MVKSSPTDIVRAPSAATVPPTVTVESDQK